MYPPRTLNEVHGGLAKLLNLHALEPFHCFGIRMLAICGPLQQAYHGLDQRCQHVGQQIVVHPFPCPYFTQHDAHRILITD
jgi:hypothetical protein